MSTLPAALGDVLEFLRAHAPPDVYEPRDLERVVAAADVEFFLAGSTIFGRDAQPLEQLRVVRTGAVEMVLDERVLEQLGPGDCFGHAAMLSRLPAGVAARAHEDTLCYRLPAQPVQARAHSGPGAPTHRTAARAYKRTRLPRGRTPWREARYCAVDLELSGLDPKRHEIVSYGAVPIEDGRVQLGAAVHGRVRPRGAISEAAAQVHGIRAADLADAPPLEDAIDPLLGALAGRVPVAHVAAIERGFLRPALRRLGVRLRRPMIDTSVLGLVWLYERDGSAPRHTSLSALADTLGLPAHRPHDALGDALTTAQAFVALAAHLDARRAETVRSLISAERRLDWLRRR
ncbi:MAG TPA: exonuclease domain-containing protein [Solirubrobacteraceae bacterium]|nr:exonuclease domain-containing protein [Solirubrobacteraceae bacterium]